MGKKFLFSTSKSWQRFREFMRLLMRLVLLHLLPRRVVGSRQPLDLIFKKNSTVSNWIFGLVYRAGRRGGPWLPLIRPRPFFARIIFTRVIRPSSNIEGGGGEEEEEEEGETFFLLGKNLGTLEARDIAITTARRPVELIRPKLKCSLRRWALSFASLDWRSFTCLLFAIPHSLLGFQNRGITEDNPIRFNGLQIFA